MILGPVRVLMRPRPVGGSEDRGHRGARRGFPGRDCPGHPPPSISRKDEHLPKGHLCSPWGSTVEGAGGGPGRWGMGWMAPAGMSPGVVWERRIPKLACLGPTGFSLWHLNTALPCPPKEKLFFLQPRDGLKEGA